MAWLSPVCPRFLPGHPRCGARPGRGGVRSQSCWQHRGRSQPWQTMALAALRGARPGLTWPQRRGCWREARWGEEIRTGSSSPVGCGAWRDGRRVPACERAPCPFSMPPRPSCPYMAPLYPATPLAPPVQAGVTRPSRSVSGGDLGLMPGSGAGCDGGTRAGWRRGRLQALGVTEGGFSP